MTARYSVNPSSKSVRRALAGALGLVLATRAPATPAQAVVAQRLVQAGDVTGMELSIEGALRVPRGGRARWLLTAHEVVGLSDLRPAPRARVRVLSSLVRDRAVAEVAADALGRAEVGIDVPADAPPVFHVVFEVLSARNVRRQFDVDVASDPGRAVVLEVDRASVLPGRAVHAWGRVISTVTRQAVPDVDVVFTATDERGRPAVPEVRLHTDAVGGFAHTLEMPAAASGALTLRARVGERDLAASATASVSPARLTTPALVMRAAAAQTVVAPGQLVAIDVVVRTGDGRPVRGAIVTSPLSRTPRGDEVQLRTDARGRVRFSLAAPETAAPAQDVDIPLRATRVGLGVADSTARLRVARAPLFAAVAVEGGALMPGLPGRLYVRVVGADGAPAPTGVTVALTGPRFPAGLTATTDADGAAVLDVTLAAPRTTPAGPAAGGAADDECGGGTATSYALALTRGGDHAAASGCVAVDPDATVRVRTPDGPLAQAGAPLRIALTRAPSAARLPIEVALVARRGEQLVPLTARTLAPGADTVELAIPPDAAGLVVVRARPLYGATALALRGGVTTVWAVPGARFAVSARVAPGARQAVVDTAASGPAPSAIEGVAAVLPRDDAEALLQRIRARADIAPLGALHTDPGRAGSTLVAGALAASTRLDDAAPAVLRAGRVVTLPAPERPALRGTLRDPWRASARFVQGRLAQVFRAIETHVAAAVRTERDNVAVRGPDGRWTFNREIFDVIASAPELVGQGARGLGGAPLTIDVLRRLDPAFTYDNVARRVTRRRMFAALLALRGFVAQNALDLRWSWRGDPSTWLRELVARGALSDDDVLDGWGTALALRPAPGGRPRFGFVAPVAGFELVSAGPDGRFATGDDMVNPFARVLPSGGAYARAVDEDGLVARLLGVELGRTTIGQLAGMFNASPNGDGADDGGPGANGGASNWDALPSRLEADPLALSVVRPGLWADAAVAPLTAFGEGATEVPVRVDDEPRTYALVVDAWSAGGYDATTLAPFAAGTPVLVDLPLAGGDDPATVATPARLRVDEPVRVEAAVTNLGDAAQTYRVEVRAEGPIEAHAPASVAVGAGEVSTFEIALRATAPGAGVLRLVLRDAQNAVVREVRAPLAADTGALPLRLDAEGVARNGAALALVASVPPGTRVTGARVVLNTAGTLADDPELARVRRSDPALIAWAYTLAARARPATLAAALLRAQDPDGAVRPRALAPTPEDSGAGALAGASPALSTTCALVAWSAADEDDAASAQARAQAAAVLPALRGTLDDPDGAAGRLREAAAVLAALANGGSPTPDGDEGDPVGAFAESLRAELRNARQAFGAQPTLLARAAAALLLADPADERGVALFAEARRAVTGTGDGMVVRGGAGRTREEEQLVATAALAVAAQQRGEVDLTARLARSVATRAHVAMRLGGEAAFWVLAAASYGVYGLGAPDVIDVAGSDGAHRVTLRDGSAIVPLAATAGAATHVTVRATGRDPADTAAVFARLEVLYEHSYERVTRGPLRLALEGDDGYAGEVSALELSVRNALTTPVARPVIEVRLPAGARLEASARQALRQRSGVVSVTVRDEGIVRVVLRGLAGAQTVELPLAVRWLARGRVTGFGAAAYLEDHGDELTQLPPRVVDLRPRPEE